MSIEVIFVVLLLSIERFALLLLSSLIVPPLSDNVVAFKLGILSPNSTLYLNFNVLLSSLIES